MSSTTHRTSRDLEMNLWGGRFTVPAGTEVTLVRDASGTEGDLYAVASVALLMQLTGNTHDPTYRYAWVPNDAVEEVTR